MDRYIRTRAPNANNYEAEYAVRDLDDGGIVTMITYAASGLTAALVGERRSTSHTAHYIRPELGEMRSYNYHTDAALAASSLVSETVLRTYSDPFRVEIAVQQKAARFGGPVVAAVLAQTIKDLGLEAEVSANGHSPSEEGGLSALSSPIPDAEMTTETYWTRLKEMYLQKGAEPLSDGSILVKSSGWLSATSYTTMALSDQGATVVSKDHGADESRQAVRGWGYQRVLSDPVRVEMYYVAAELRSSGKDAAAMGEAIVSEVLKFGQEEQR